MATMTLIAANRAETTLAAGINDSATSLTVAAGTGAIFPKPVSGTSFFKLTLIDAATESNSEIVHVTAVSGDTFTIVRAQEGTLKRSWSVNDIAANMVTAGTIELMAQLYSPVFTGDPRAPTPAAGDNDTSIATTAFVTAAIAGGRSRAPFLITASRTYIPTPGTTAILFKSLSGGGGGGGCPSTNTSQQATAGGGYSGSYAEVFTPSVAASYSIIVGSAGTPGARTGTSGGGGGATSIQGVVSCPGGGGGFPGVATVPTASIGGISDSYTMPTITSGVMLLQRPSQAGTPALILGSGTNQAVGGTGGSSQRGNGGRGGLGGAPGLPGSGYGSGGGGCSQIAGNNGDAGGAGTQGVVEVWEFY